MYWERFELIYKVFRLMGYMPYTINTNDGKLTKSVKAALWTIFACCIQVTIIMIGNKKRLEEEKFWATYDVALESLERLMMTNTLVIFTTVWWEYPKIIDYVNCWDISLDHLQTYSMIPLNCFKLNLMKVILILNTAVVLIAILLDQILLLGGIQPTLVIHYFITIYFITLFTTFWAMNCFFISGIVTWLRDNIIAMLILNPTPEALKAFRLLWFQIQGQVFKFSESVKITTLLHLLLSHVTLIFNTYVLMSTVIYTQDFYRCLGFLGPQLFIVIIILSLCEPSNQVSKVSGYNFFSHVFSIRYTTYQQEILRELEFFLEAMEGKSSDIVLGESLVINRGLILAMVSTTLTYLVVLMQFYVSQK